MLKVEKKEKMFYIQRKHEICTGKRMERQANVAQETHKPCKGVKEKAVVSEIPHFDRAKGVCADYMHQLLL